MGVQNSPEAGLDEKMVVAAAERALSDIAAIRQEVGKVIFGQESVVEQTMLAVLSGGHALLVGVPGLAKTKLVVTLGTVLGLSSSRIQFTPDLMPGDIIGANLFNFQTSTFTLNRGPVFCELLLADEINRTPPKTQAALLEAMQERRITIDGQSHELNARFTVVATQNPIEQQGTYPLPEAQLDRFLFKHVLDYPTRDDELGIVLGHGSRAGLPSPADLGVRKVLDRAGVDAAVEAVAQVRLTEEVAGYVVDLIRATRESADIETGASPRAGAMLALAARAHAALDGRDYVIPDDVKTLAPPALRHRVILSPAAEIEGRRVDQALAALVDQVAAPR